MDSPRGKADLILNSILTSQARKKPHQRGHSDVSCLKSSRSSLTPSNSQKSFKLHLDDINSTYSVFSPSQYTTRSSKEYHKPISLVILEKYFSDICLAISNKGTIEKSLLSKAETMEDVLKDCLSSLPELSMNFYVLTTTILKEIKEIYQTQNESLYADLAKKLLQIASMIEDNKYTSDTDRITTLPAEEPVEILGLNNIANELAVRVNRLTARVLNIWKKILSPQREAFFISHSFMLLYCEVDPKVGIQPNSRVPIEKGISIMKNYIGNPGHVVMTIRKTKEYIDNEMISVENVRKINDIIGRVTPEQAKVIDKTTSGLVIYDLIIISLMYYEAYAKEHYKINIFEKNSVEDPNESKVNQDLNETEKPKAKEDVSKHRKTSSEAVQEIPRMISKKSSDSTGKIPRVAEKKVGISARPSEKGLPKKNPQVLPPKLTKNISSPPKSTKAQPSVRTSQASPSRGVKIQSPRLSKNPSGNISSNPFANRASPLRNANSRNNSSSRENLARNSPMRSSKASGPIKNDNKKKDSLVEMQYKQFIEEKFRHFLIDKLRQETERLSKAGLEMGDIKVLNEINSVKCRSVWIQEFEKSIGLIKYNALDKFADEKVFTAELIRAQRQLEVIDGIEFP